MLSLRTIAALFSAAWLSAPSAAMAQSWPSTRADLDATEGACLKSGGAADQCLMDAFSIDDRSQLNALQTHCASLRDGYAARDCLQASRLWTANPP
jgi:hypothetical protein